MPTARRSPAASRRVVRDGFLTPPEIDALVGASVLAMAGSYHRGGHTSVGVPADPEAAGRVGAEGMAVLAAVRERVRQAVARDHRCGGGGGGGGGGGPSALSPNGGMLIRVQGGAALAAFAPLDRDPHKAYWAPHVDKVR